MPSSTAKGVPYSLGTDAVATIDNTLQSLAEWVDLNPGVRVITTTERDALVGADLWNGRVVMNVSSGQLERYDSAAATWRNLSATAKTIRDTSHWTVQGDVRVDNATNDFYINPYFISLPTGQTNTFRGVLARLHAGTAECAIDRFKASDGTVTRLMTFSATTTDTFTAPLAPVALADRDRLHLIIVSVASARHLTASALHDLVV